MSLTEYQQSVCRVIARNRVAQGESYDQRVGLLVHNGDAETGNVAKRYRAYCDGEL